VYRKLHPAINKSVYEPGDGIPVFTVSGLTFGIIICNDSNFLEPARSMASKGATALFVPTNNGLPANRGGVELVLQARAVDIARAIANSVAVIRADVSGFADGRVSYGSSAIIDSNGVVLQAAPLLLETLLVAEIETTPQRRR
jgi:5-aminopentanamidase